MNKGNRWGVGRGRVVRSLVMKAEQPGGLHYFPLFILFTLWIRWIRETDEDKDKDKLRTLEKLQSHSSRTVHSDCLTCACAKTFLGGGRRRKTLRTTSLWRFRHLGQPEPTGAISVTENVSEPRFCMVMYFSSQLRRNYVSGRWEIFKNRKQPKIGHFWPFSGSQRLIFTHPTSQWSYIMPLG